MVFDLALDNRAGGANYAPSVATLLWHKVSLLLDVAARQAPVFVSTECSQRPQLNMLRLSLILTAGKNF